MGRWFSDYLARLNRSFAAVYAILERPRAARRAVVGLLAVHTALLAYSAYVHSPTLNEPGHLVAGLSYWKFGRFDVYSVNPPLVKLVAALPVMAAGYEEDWSGFYTGLGARPEFAMGEDFVAANGERSFFLFMIARWACIPFSWLGGVICYLWARDLYGRPVGVIACAIWSFEPNILAHASLMTPDAHATALGLAACYTFWRWLKHPTWKQTVVTGVVLGLAELAKTTFILFYPLWPLLWLAHRWPDRRTIGLRQWIREAGMLAVRMSIGLYVLNLGYGFESSLTRLRDFHFVSNLFTGNTLDVESTAESPSSSESWERRATSPNDAHQGVNIQRTRTDNRFANSWLASVPVPFPVNYLVGIDLQQRDFEHWGQPSYLRGEWREQGWWYYYLYVASIKVPLGLWALVLLACMFRVARSCQRALSCNWPTQLTGYPISAFRDEFILLFTPLVILSVVSSKTEFSEHFRYILPSFPFIFIVISGFSNFCLDIAMRDAVDSTLGQLRIIANYTGPICLAWLIASSLWISPHHLSYFNELVGGPLNGHKHVCGSGLDWGQDLRYALWSQASSDRQRTSLLFFSHYDPFSLIGVKQSQCLDCDPYSAREFVIGRSLLSGYRWMIRMPNGKFSMGPTIRSRVAAGEAFPLSYSVALVRIIPEKKASERQ